MHSSIRIAAVAATLAVALALAAPVADAKTLRWADRGDMQTTDPHSQNENLTNNINQPRLRVPGRSATRSCT